MATKALEVEAKEAVNGVNGVAPVEMAQEQVEEAVQPGNAPMVIMVRKVLLAGVGAFALTVDEVEEFVTRLVERGELAEQDGRKVIADVLARRRNEAEATTEKVTEKVQEQTTRHWSRAEAMLDQQIDNILARFNVPSKSDIEALSSKIGELAEKVDALRQN